jgi:hypothetical protein
VIELINLLQSDIRLRLQTKMVKAFNTLMRRRPTSEPYLSGDTFRNIATHIFERSIEKKTFKNNFKSGDIIFCETHLLEMFQRYVLPCINTRFVLISHNSDMNVTERFSTLLNSRYLEHWFAQNNFLRHIKISSIPIGLENSWMNNNGLVTAYTSIRQINVEKIPRILYGFNVRTNITERAIALRELMQSSVTNQIDVDAHRYRKILNRYMFVASPQGNGIDCHRTWEALYLNAVPIVTKHEFYNTLPNFPGLILNEWSDISKFTERDLALIYREKIQNIKHSEMLWFSYWRNKIFEAVDRCANPLVD